MQSLLVQLNCNEFSNFYFKILRLPLAQSSTISQKLRKMTVAFYVFLMCYQRYYEGLMISSDDQSEARPEELVSCKLVCNFKWPQFCTIFSLFHFSHQCWCWRVKGWSSWLEFQCSRSLWWHPPQDQPYLLKNEQISIVQRELHRNVDKQA